MGFPNSLMLYVHTVKKIQPPSKAKALGISREKPLYSVPGSVGVTADAAGEYMGEGILILQTIKQLYAEFDADFESLEKVAKSFFLNSNTLKVNEFPCTVERFRPL